MTEEDKVEYWLYPTDPDTSGLSTLATIWKLVEGLANQYLWHQQIFNLRVEESKDGWCLYGSVDYGENVEDEWMVVSLLIHITSSVGCLTARVLDTDGEILLIEAADLVPRWAGEPAVAEGRVFIYNGEVHLIPVCKTPGDVTPFPWGTPDPWFASRFISEYPQFSRADDSVQQAIVKRIGKFPTDVSSNHHTTTVLLPDLVAAVLHHNNQGVCDLINALKDKDHLDLRNTRTMSRVKQRKMKRYSVTFPKCLYALLSSIKVRPYRASGWEVQENSKEEVLGYQLSLGLEIILSRYRSENDDTGSSKSWENFKRKLMDVGYFQGEIEGSINHKILVRRATEFWQSSLEDSNHSRLDQLVNTFQRCETDGIMEPADGWLKPGGVQENEQWMQITPESLDRMLADRFGAPPGGEEDIPGQLNTFLNKMSDMAGVGDPDSVDLDPSNLLASMRKLLGEQEEQDLDTSDSEDEGEQDPIIMDYMNRLDEEVVGVKGRDELPDQDKPMDIDSSVLSNLLASYSAELGLSGPASSLLNTLGINPGRSTDPS